MGIVTRLRDDDRGQMTVELCVVIPICLIIAVIVMNSLTFFASCAEFDRLGRNAVRIVAASPSDGETSAQMISKIVQLIEDEMETVEVSCVIEGSSVDRGSIPGSSSYDTFSLSFEYAPTLFGLPMRGSVFGVSFPKLKHGISLTVDSYTPGKLFG